MTNKVIFPLSIKGIKRKIRKGKDEKILAFEIRT